MSRHFAEFVATIASGEEPRWRARIGIRSPGSGSPSLHACDQPEDAFNIQGAWEAIRTYWFADPPVVNAAEFESVEESLGQRLPADYKWFLMESNGGETLEPLERVSLYQLEELLPRREDGQPPDVLEIATNDSDGYAFDLAMNRETAHYPVVRYSLGERDRMYMERVSRHFAEFLAIIASGEEP